MRAAAPSSRLTAIAIAAVALLVAAPARAEGPEIPLIEVPAPGTGSVDLRVLFAVGSAHDPAGQEGIAALTARLMVDGATLDRSYEAIQEALYPMGASIGVQVSREQVVFRARCHASHARAVVALLIEVITRPALLPADFARVHRKLRAHIADGVRGSDDEALGKEVLNLALYERHPYGHLDAGTLTSLDRMTPDDARAFHRRAFVRGAVQVAVGGELDDGLTTALREGLAALPEGEPPTLALPEPPAIEATQAVLIEKGATATAISIGFPLTVRRGDPDWLPLLVAASWLGEHRQFTGHLFQRMRAVRGLNYGAYAYSEWFEQAGFSIRPRTNTARRQQTFSLWIRPVPHDKRTFAVKLALFELRRLIERGITQDELDATRDFLRGYGRVLEETVGRRLGYRLDDRFYGTDGFPARLGEALSALTVEQVRAAVRRHLRADRLVIVAVTRDAGSMAAELLDPRPLPVRYDAAMPAAVLEEDLAITDVDVGLTVETIRIIDADALFERAGLPRGARPR